jgi:hypothetical protein
LHFKTSCFEVHLSDDGDDDTDSNKVGKSLGEFDRRSNHKNGDKSNCKSDEHDYEIGYYMNLTDDIDSSLGNKEKGDLKVD